jgi:hypothetical protein
MISMYENFPREPLHVVIYALDLPRHARRGKGLCEEPHALHKNRFLSSGTTDGGRDAFRLLANLLDIRHNERGEGIGINTAPTGHAGPSTLVDDAAEANASSEVAIGCGMLLLERYDARADSGVRPAGGGKSWPPRWRWNGINEVSSSSSLFTVSKLEDVQVRRRAVNRDW